MSFTPPRRIVGNLDAEIELAAQALGRPRQMLNRATLVAISDAATLLRVFARDDDRLWTPLPVDPARLVDIPGLPRVALESGPRSALAPVVAELPWMETPTASRQPDTEAEAEAGEPWGLAASATGAVARVADRTWGLAQATRLGFALADSRAVASVAELDAALVALAGRPWVLKAAFSAAGRDRLTSVAGAARFFARHGRGVVEPWLDRLADFGATSEVDGSGAVRRESVHRLGVDAAGRFVGIELTVGEPTVAPGLKSAEFDCLAAALAAAGAALAAVGYRGPFGLDAFRHRLADGTPAFQPWVELNPRLTFGRVARALVDRVAAALDWPAGEAVRLEFGRAPPVGATILLRGPGSAWLQRMPVSPSALLAPQR